MNAVSKRLANKDGGKIKAIITEEDKAAAAKDTFTTSLFGGRAAEAYASGLRPMNISNNIVYVNRSDNFKLEGGGRIGFKVNPSTRQFNIVKINDDGTMNELDSPRSDYSNVDGNRVMDMVNSLYQGRFDIIQEALKGNKPIPPVGAALAKKS